MANSYAAKINQGERKALCLGGDFLDVTLSAHMKSKQYRP
jgi:hypothetical protein